MINIKDFAFGLLGALWVVLMIWLVIIWREVRTIGFVCIGDQSHLILRFLNFEGCGETWWKDSLDGKCPICRGYLVPTSFQKEKPTDGNQ